MAEEQKLSSKKRKRQSITSNNPLVGIFTRSKSLLYLHGNRSGRARFDSLRQDLNISEPLSKKGRRRVLTQDSSNDDDLSCILIKDLRTRRIYSNGPGLSDENEERKHFEKGIGISEIGYSGNSIFDRNAVHASESQERGRIEKLNLGLCSTDTNQEPRKYEEGDVSNGVGGMVEEPMQSAPPDNEALIDTKEAKENEEQQVESVREQQSNESHHWNVDINKRDGNSRTNSFLRYRVKLFKAPGSFSYRRLLPYLMDISEDKPFLTGGPKMGQSQKFGKDVDEKPQSNCHGQDILINKSTRESCLDESNDVDLVNKSKSTSVDFIRESQKEPCMGSDFSHTSISMVNEWSKPIMNWGIERVDTRTGSKKWNFGLNNSVGAISDDTKPMGNGEIANIDVGKSCNAQNADNLNWSVSLVLKKCNSGKDNSDGQCFEDRKQSKLGHSSKVNASLPSTKPNENSSDAEQRDDDGGEVLDRIDNSNKEYIQLTPPDDDIFGKPAGAETRDNSVNSLHNACSFLGKSLAERNYENKNSADDKLICSSPTRKVVLSQCSRLKLFKTPGSLGYRRMLPFLMDVAKDNSSAGRGHLLKLEKCFDAEPLSPSLVSNRQEIPAENYNGNDGHPERPTGADSALPIAEKMVALNNQEKSNESPKPLHSQQETDAHFEQDLSDAAIKTETGPEIKDIIHGSTLPGTSLCSLFRSGFFLKEGARQASSLDHEEDCDKSVTEVSDNAKRIETESLLQYSSHHTNTFCLKTPAAVAENGILKRTPRGCRGLCTCLNCSSFRLHAEKAFDFSRNQMQDAEEVVLDLIKELSYLRNTLEKSAFSADGHVLVCASQVKEACRRTCEAEELARNRLNQMNFDLNIHCRVTCSERPRVTFSNYVKEKEITKSGLPSEYRLIRTGNEENL